MPSDAANALALVEREMKGEVHLKKSEAGWLATTGKEVEREETADSVRTAWEELQTDVNSTADKLTQINKVSYYRQK